MILADIGTELARLIETAVAAGDLPPSARTSSPNATWRPVPSQDDGGAGSYATSLPFSLASEASLVPRTVAARLAAGLGSLPWISAARVTGDGYLTITVTTAQLAGLAARVIAAGPAIVRSDALVGASLSCPRMPDLAAARTWEEAWREHRASLAGPLWLAAGAEVAFRYSELSPRTESLTQAGSGPVAAAMAYYGADAVRYALARSSNGDAAQVERQLALPLDLSNPFALVSYAHKDAASTLRWAADLGWPTDEEAAAAAQPLPPELALLDGISWLPERVAAAARRRRPAELAAHLEYLARAWLDCSESCPALPFRGQHAPAGPGGGQAAARLELAGAARIALAAGLDLLGVSASPWM